MNEKLDSMENVFTRFFDKTKKARQEFQLRLTPKEVGTIISVTMGIVKITGLPGVGSEELVKFPGDLYGMAFNVDEDEVGVILLDEYSHLNVGDKVERTYRVMDVAVGEKLLGRVINPLSHPLDEKGPLHFFEYLPIERPAPSIISRLPITAPLQTGIKVIDALVPIGKGQRALILGDRQTGKTAIAVNTIINQRDKDVICIYCAIGLRASSTAKVIDTLRKHHAMDYTVVVVTEGNNPPGLTYIAPYAATSIAEYFLKQGKDTLIVYDDLTHHARAYRELSLLMRRPPGREAFPGNIFYIHSRLLERATHLSDKLGGGSLTALPIIETEEENISAYIPTNLISMTDGQIYLSPTLFSLGMLPAVDVNKSVSRVGGGAQLPIYRNIASTLKLDYAQFEELESFSRFGATLNEETVKIIEYGQRIRACLKQKEVESIPIPTQILILLALTNALLKNISLNQISEALRSLVYATEEIPKEIVEQFYTAEKLDEEKLQMLIDIIKKSFSNFYPKTEQSEQV